MNVLPRLDPVIDGLIAHPAILPYLKEFMGEPQLVNTWAISKLDAAVYSRAFHRRTKGTDELDDFEPQRI